MAQEPAERHLRGGGAGLGRHSGDLGARPRLPPGDRAPRPERDPGRLAGREYQLVLAAWQALPVLHARNADDPPCPIEFADRDLGQPDPADPALGPQLTQRAELVGERRPRIDTVQLKQLDPPDAQPPQRLLDLIAHNGRPPPVELPPTQAGPIGQRRPW